MKNLVLSAAMVAGLAGSAFGQIDPTRFQLELGLVGRAYSSISPGTSEVATDISSPLSVSSTGADPNTRTVRLEIRYRIVVTNSTTGNYTSGGSTFASAGLSSVSLDLTSTRALSATGDLHAAQISTQAVANSYANPDTLDLTDGNLGMYNPFRTGVFADVPPGTGLGSSNGTYAATGLTNILPIATSAPGQRSDVTGGPSGLANGRIWGLFAVDFTVPQNAPAGSYTFHLQQNAGSLDWLFFPRTGTANASAAINGTGGVTFTNSSFTVNVVPAPASVALLGLGGLVAARRRRVMA